MKSLRAVPQLRCCPDFLRKGALLNVLYAGSAIGAMTLYRRVRAREGMWMSIGMLFVSVGFLLPLMPKAPVLVISNLLTTIGRAAFDRQSNES